MKTWTLLTVLAAAITLTAMPAVAQDQNAPAKPSGETTSPAKDEPRRDPSASPATGGDTNPSAVDPGQSTKTGANTGEGASYNRSSEKGDSAMPKEDKDKTK